MSCLLDRRTDTAIDCGIRFLCCPTTIVEAKPTYRATSIGYRIDIRRMSPEEQRSECDITNRGRFAGTNFVAIHWHGGFPLSRAYWVNNWLLLLLWIQAIAAVVASGLPRVSACGPPGSGRLLSCWPA